MDDARGWHTPVPDQHPAAALLSAVAVRRHCEQVMAYVVEGDSPHFAWHGDRLAETAVYVADVIRERDPALSVPYHSRWRQFEAGGVDRWGEVRRAIRRTGPDQKDGLARVRIDMVIPNVLLDAGAGSEWKFRDTSTRPMLTRSEGLGVASLVLFAAGALSNFRSQPLRSDAAALLRIRPDDIARAFSVSATNPLVGLGGRATLLARLGDIAATTPAVFGSPARLGNLYDYLKSHAANHQIDAGFILATLLRALGPVGPVWPQHLILDGVSLGHCWPQDCRAKARRRATTGAYRQRRHGILSAPRKNNRRTRCTRIFQT